MSALDELIYDRTQSDVTYAAELNRKLGRGEALTEQELADWNAGLKGAYNAADMNRVDAAVRELGGMLTAAGYPVRYTSPVPQPEPLEYTQVEYIESDGTQYVDTGYKPNNNTRVVLDFQITNNLNAINGLFGSRNATSATATLSFDFWGYNSTTFRTNFFGQDATINGLSSSEHYTVDKDKNVTAISDKTVTIKNTIGQCNLNLYLLCINVAATADYFAHARIYECKIYDDDILVRDFVPAKKDGIIGLYDKVGKKMYGNSGVGDFIAGEVVPQSQPEPTKTEFEIGDIITYEIWRTYLNNVQAVRDAYYVMPDSPTLPEPTAPLTYTGTNAIERLIYDIHQVYDAMVEMYRICGTFAAGNNFILQYIRRANIGSSTI